MTPFEEVQKAAQVMRDDHGPEHVRYEFWQYLADWLESHADVIAEHEECGTDCGYFDPATDHGLAVARAYLGEG